MMIRRMATDVIKETYRRMDRVEYIKQDNFNTVGYEVGYLVFVINERYRRMIDKYNTTMTMQGALYQMEHVMFLQDVEMNYWELEHLMNMLHEVERKYKIETSILSTYHEMNSKEVQEEKARIAKEKKAAKMKGKGVGSDPLGSNYPGQNRPRKKKKQFVLSDYIKNRLNPTTTQKTRWWWPIEYGWEIDYWW
ncbi:uncharacterized protein LOC113509038 [Trichoplusia ni]|uniref:Uncharacterized protein LOC113509038 n=1 Tax=Trichoplusia ni TaxID=7111 RepID=A0A7E5X661_TRINI|nr:uncharacterized protein LOC113509038 [Trichoplusia ni]